MHDPRRAYQRAVLARACAGLGRRKDALCEDSPELLPISKDAKGADGCRQLSSA